MDLLLLMDKKGLEKLILCKDAKNQNKMEY